MLVAFLATFSPSADPAEAGRGTELLAAPKRVVVRDLPTATGPRARAAAERVAPPRRRPVIPATTAQLSGVPAANAAASAAAASGPEVLASAFEGIDNNDNASVAGFTVTPPDPQVAAGPGHVLEMTNVTGRIFDKKGATLQTFLLRDFFEVPAGWFDTDPRVIYDALAGRWFASYASLTDNPGAATDLGRLHIAVSQTDDPTGAWNIYFLEYTDVFPDYPGIGLTDDKFTASVNIFDIDEARLDPPCARPFAFCGEQTVVVEKADLLAGVAAPSFSFPLNTNRFTVRPAHSLSSINDQYLATFDLTSGLPSTSLTLIRVTGRPGAGNVTEASADILPILSQSDPPLSQTAGGGTIDSGDFRLLDASWRNGTLWASASARCVPAGDTSVRSCAHLVAVNAAAATVTQDIMFGEPGQHYSWPAVRTDPSGNLFVSLTHTNSTIFAEAVAAGRRASDPVNTLGGVSLLRAGDVVHTSSRWGDYLSVAVDPADPACVWITGEYAKATAGHDWGTYIAAVHYDTGCDRDADGWLNSADNCPDWANAAQSLPAWPIPAGDGDCDGFSSADEALTGTDPATHCAATPDASDEPPPDAWPFDFNDDRRATLTDVLSFTSVFNSTAADPQYNPRYDLRPDGIIGLSDILLFIRVFNGTCAG
ncbi:MAG: hypothetical protein Q7T33_11470 [Dehalococcoidia bacterium]|nr:hypothetical protein [Dehalococcoidia bacterium]